MKSPRCNRLYILLRGPTLYYRRPYYKRGQPFRHANLLLWWWAIKRGHRAYCGCDLP